MQGFCICCDESSGSILIAAIDSCHGFISHPALELALKDRKALLQVKPDAIRHYVGLAIHKLGDQMQGPWPSALEVHHRVVHGRAMSNRRCLNGKGSQRSITITITKRTTVTPTN